MSTLLILGGSGLIGKRFITTQSIHFKEIRLLSRTPGTHDGITAFAWDPAQGTYDPMAFIDVDYVLNLAGAGIADKPWTANRKRELLESRVDSLKTLRKALQETGAKPKLVISASATGFYGDRDDEWVDETSPAGSPDLFLSHTSVEWEAAARPLADDGHPLALLRIGIVLSNEGGALPKLLLPLKAGVANYFGNGDQYMPWIHIDDLCKLINWLFQEQQVGVWNGVAPNPATSKEMAQALARLKGAWLTTGVPAFMLKLAMGAMAETVLTGARVRADKVQKAGFTFRYPHLHEALEHLQ